MEGVERDHALARQRPPVGAVVEDVAQDRLAAPQRHAGSPTVRAWRRRRASAGVACRSASAGRKSSAFATGAPARRASRIRMRHSRSVQGRKSTLAVAQEALRVAPLLARARHLAKDLDVSGRWRSANGPCRRRAPRPQGSSTSRVVAHRSCLATRGPRCGHSARRTPGRRAYDVPCAAAAGEVQGRRGRALPGAPRRRWPSATRLAASAVVERSRRQRRAARGELAAVERMRHAPEVRHRAPARARAARRRRPTRISGHGMAPWRQPRAGAEPERRRGALDRGEELVSPVTEWPAKVKRSNGASSASDATGDERARQIGQVGPGVRRAPGRRGRRACRRRST